jgi:hypothetical protein
MIPAIFPGARLSVRPVDPGEVRVGDIVCFPCPDRTMAAHRVVGIEQGDGKRAFLTRGDAQDGFERIEATAIASRVDRVQQRFLSYDATDRLGRLFARLALVESRPGRLARRALVGVSSRALRLWAKAFA